MLAVQPFEQIDRARVAGFLLGARNPRPRNEARQLFGELHAVRVRRRELLSQRVVHHRHEPELVHGLGGEHVRGGEQVAEVGRIEAAAEERDLTHR